MFPEADRIRLVRTIALLVILIAALYTMLIWQCLQAGG